ncbi:hypothetical protein H2198_003578 [Neophaeococcomyces mojaviensis]|uniref:Uncharacterized protein n=1 Tax=Neophaeococcomyces mojaviensis TaxID=3383035 RepID=A0ACC3ABN0_9EURO|nr:hypothetical protein H2198_003578 [Knufia sp. JES_112]
MSTATASVVSGVLPHAQDAPEELASFEKILNLRDLIFAGNHPRLSVPAHAVRKISPQLSSQSATAVVPPPPVPAQQPVQSQLPGLSITHEQAEEQEKPNNLAPTARPPPTTTPSGINPVLLGKSPELIKAEHALHRQRLEKQLRDQFEQKRLDFRKRPAPAEAKPEFDISALLAKALEVAKPVSLSKEQSDKDEEDESFDENSLYSSRAPDSTPDPREPSPPSPEQPLQLNVDANGLAEAPSTHTAQPPFDHPQRISSRTDANPFNVQKSVAAAAVAEKSQDNTDSNAMEMDDDDEEGEYSPPEAMDQYPAQNGNAQQMVPDPRSRPVRRYSDLDHNRKRPASPSEPNMRIVRNHITSPIAPQPSRVSPLALAKDSLVSQDRRYQNGHQRGRADSRSQSPEESVQQRNKRRKLEKRAERKARRGVKQEAVSPPPFHDIQPLGQIKLPPQDNRPIVIDDQPPQDIRYVQPAPRYVESPQRPLSRAPEHQLVPLSEPRVLSRTTMRPRDDQDLRRVASMHNMRAEQPREYVEYASPLRPRATSYMRVDSPMREVPQYVHEIERPQQEVRVIRTPAPEYREAYAQAEPEVRYIPEPMPPPPRERIVVDQYGRRFREIVQERTPAPPRVSSSYIERDPSQYYDSYNQVRAGSLMVEERPGQRYEQEMPPPQIVRQVADHQSEALASARQDGYDRPPLPRTASVVYERATRQPIYPEPPADLRPPVRMSSVRPPPSQYEEQPVMQMVPRAASVRPGREGSVFVDDRGSIRREYLPVEQPRYRVVEPEPQPRYVDAQGREVIPTGHDDGGMRYVQRY